MPGGLEKLHGLSPFLAWCLSSSPLISLSLSVFFHPPFPYLLRLALTVYPPASHCYVHSSLFCLSLSISQCHSCSVAFFTPLPTDIPLFLFLPPLSSFLAMPLPLLSFCECITLTIPLALPTRFWISMTGPPWVLLAGQFSAKKCLKKGPLILKIYYR